MIYVIETKLNGYRKLANSKNGNPRYDLDTEAGTYRTKPDIQDSYRVKVGAANATDAGVMAQFCDSTLQILVGAASPQLVWEGAQKRNMTALELLALANEDPHAVHELMWL